MEAWATLSFKIIRPCVFAFVYFSFGFNVLLSGTCFWALLRYIFIGNSFRFCIKLCLFTYFTSNSCVGLSFISIFSHFGIHLVFVLFYSVFVSVSSGPCVWHVIQDFLDFSWVHGSFFFWECVVYYLRLPGFIWLCVNILSECVAYFIIFVWYNLHLGSLI